MKKLIIVLLLLLLPLTARAEEASLTFSSFDGGGPEFSITIEDPEIVAYTSARHYSDPDHDTQTGSGYTVTYTFIGQKAGNTRMTVSARSPIADNFDADYTVTVDESLRVTLHAEKKLAYLYVYRYGYNAPISYEVTLLNGEYRLFVNNGPAVPLPADAARALCALAEAYDLAAWDGFSARSDGVLDGEGFWLEMSFSDGSSLQASGDNAFPPHYFDVMGGIADILESAASWAFLPEPIDDASYLTVLADDAYYTLGESTLADFAAHSWAVTAEADGTYSLCKRETYVYARTRGGAPDAPITALDLMWADGIPTLYLGFGAGTDTDAEAGPTLWDWLTDHLMADINEEGTLAATVTLSDGRALRIETKDVRVRLTLEVQMNVKINDIPVAVQWEDNASVDALYALAQKGPLTIQLSMYGGFEQVGPLGQRLPRADAQTTTRAGDIVLYSGDQIVVFYGSNSWAYTRLGRITDQTPDGLRALLGQDDATLTISAE